MDTRSSTRSRPDGRALRFPGMRANDDAPEVDLPDPDQVYRNYVESCRRCGVKPVSRERAQGLIEEWTVALTGGAIRTRESMSRSRSSSYRYA